MSTRFDADEAVALDAAVSASGAPSRSVFVRNCIRRCIEADKKKAARLKATGSETLS